MGLSPEHDCLGKLLVFRFWQASIVSAVMASVVVGCDPPPGIVRLHRLSDNKQALCFLGSGGFEPNSLGHYASPEINRCLAACERLGFVIEQKFPDDLVVDTTGRDQVRSDYCSIMLRKMW